ncbi:hypothetical protein H257_09902 [Aphanomyces astaci]|uniref:DDE-1 domain-containing protein n=1 Tax=Aphanomyces astaci TaxID=112090 RepID=W4GAG1_APHAT|nr:hypothetical protein H257_09902 [Aphanomyces astaci]ETV75943.1 hypothetical protein H257_09902 [Aphanomyces astaci]|eukprot:XP_009834585.1 hypothetical protein H257_09902 [Aphanomyces astaci]
MEFGNASQTRSGQAKLAEGEKALVEFKNSIQKIIKDHNIDEIYNTDQTGINYDAHFTDDVIARTKELTVHFARIPPTFTWLVKPIKASMKLKWVQYLRKEVAQSGVARRKDFRLKCPKR